MEKEAIALNMTVNFGHITTQQLLELSAVGVTMGVSLTLGVVIVIGFLSLFNDDKDKNKNKKQ